MNNRTVMCLVLAASLGLTVGCQSGTPRPRTIADPADLGLHQGYAILYSTLKDESQLDKALILKNPGEDVEELVKDIARFAGDAASRLETFAREDPALNLVDDGLPELETASRKSISSSTGKQILLSGGKEFAFNILQTQAEALKYIHALAGQLAEREREAARDEFLLDVVEKSDLLHALVIERLKRPFIETAQ